MRIVSAALLVFFYAPEGHSALLRGVNNDIDAEDDEKPPAGPDYLISEFLAPKHCGGEAPLFEGLSNGTFDCRKRCNAVDCCMFFSIWPSGWCRLGASCDKLIPLRHKNVNVTNWKKVSNRTPECQAIENARVAALAPERAKEEEAKKKTQEAEFEKVRHEAAKSMKELAKQKVQEDLAKERAKRAAELEKQKKQHAVQKEKEKVRILEAAQKELEAKKAAKHKAKTQTLEIKHQQEAKKQAEKTEGTPEYEEVQTQKAQQQEKKDTHHLEKKQKVEQKHDEKTVWKDQQKKEEDDRKKQWKEQLHNMPWYKQQKEARAKEAEGKVLKKKDKLEQKEYEKNLKEHDMKQIVRKLQADGGKVTCTCNSPSSRAAEGHQKYMCGDGMQGECPLGQACSAKKPFFKLDTGAACAKVLGGKNIPLVHRTVQKSTPSPPESQRLPASSGPGMAQDEKGVEKVTYGKPVWQADSSSTAEPSWNTLTVMPGQDSSSQGLSSIQDE